MKLLKSINQMLEKNNAGLKGKLAESLMNNLPPLSTQKQTVNLSGPHVEVKPNKNDAVIAQLNKQSNELLKVEHCLRMHFR